MGKIRKYPIIEEGKIVGFEAPEKGIKILEFKIADGFQIKYIYYL